ncbi:uncharacterized protein MYCFIDRAFT_84644 [Pseudocercospora fijiensis CIRAD86]|uniref:Uncharacterized protein n=1 Tax=Pseudocercospora fijiensis (strain CIRAD86) TaxID=383855 RepID=M2YSB7_PSEFD|nr:uncharacterized protein MYCFIDRAFT_84644 [Pseudocercospora fijiensis CIRAD86]EME80620.1 hypothetical protein MYCFIDRAFT_84644 [Pseudocercospora fijiensis CIRAD86]
MVTATTTHATQAAPANQAGPANQTEEESHSLVATAKATQITDELGDEFSWKSLAAESETPENQASKQPKVMLYRDTAVQTDLTDPLIEFHAREDQYVKAAATHNLSTTATTSLL